MQRALAVVVLCPSVSEPERCGWRSGRVLVYLGYSLTSQVGKLGKQRVALIWEKEELGAGGGEWHTVKGAAGCGGGVQ